MANNPNPQQQQTDTSKPATYEVVGDASFVHAGKLYRKGAKVELPAEIAKRLNRIQPGNLRRL